MNTTLEAEEREVPKYDPWLQREVPTEMESLISSEASDIRLELRTIRGAIEDTHRELGITNNLLVQATISRGVSWVGLLIIALLLAAITLKLWFF